MLEPDAHEEAMVEIHCPFCDKLLVRDYDLTGLEEDDESGLPDPIWDISCPHVAAYCVWGSIETTVSTEWKTDVSAICQSLTIEDGIDEFVDDDCIIYIMNDMDDDERQELFSRNTNMDYVFFDVYVEKFDGVSSGGPTFMILLMNRK